MKYVRITEPDQKYVREFSAYIVANYGATLVPGRDALFEVPDDFPWPQFHGIDLVYNPEIKTFREEHAGAVAWLEAYEGDSNFFQSIKKQLQYKGSLSEAQIRPVYQAMQRTPPTRPVTTSSKPAPQPKRDFSIQPGTVIMLGRMMAKQIAAQGNCWYSHHAFEVLQVLDETDLAYRLRLRFSARRTSHCSCCGRLLTDLDSIAMGLGPVCAERAGVAFSQTALQDLAEKLKITGEITTWLPKSAIKKRFDPA